ncbi:MAG: nucleoside 2-deoxyribosyltransferase [Acidimicrobiia bacterium]|nr:nucleoside 2-deoxyribosyltransferase [Acidimicrobiia bacterium]
MAPVYLAAKYHADHSNRERVEQVSSAFEACGIATVCVQRDFERWGETAFPAHELMRIAFEAIADSSAVVIEFTEKGVGLGIEAGYAAARGVPVFVLHQPTADVSVTLQGIATGVFEYSDAGSLAKAIRSIAETLSDGQA